MTILQRLIAATAAVTLGLMLWSQYDVGSFDHGPWLMGILAITGLLIFAAHQPSEKSAGKSPLLRRPRKNHAPALVTIPSVYTSARNIAESFFKLASERTTDPKAAKNLDTNRAHLVRMFAYLAPKFILNYKIKGFSQTAADAELTAMGIGGFQAIEEFEAAIFESLLPVEFANAHALPSEEGTAGAQCVIEQLDAIFAECSSNVAAEKPFPLDRLFREFERFGPIAATDPSSRHEIYQPLFRRFFEIWDDCNVAGLDLSPLRKPEPASSHDAVDLNQALDDLLDSMEASRGRRTNTVLPAPLDLKRAILIAGLRRDEKTGLAALYDEQLTRAEIEDRSKRIRSRVSGLIDELGKAPGQRVERLFELLCRDRKDISDLEKIVRTSTSRYQDVPPLT